MALWKREREREREKGGEIRCRRKLVEKWKDRDERQQGWREEVEKKGGVGARYSALEESFLGG